MSVLAKVICTAIICLTIPATPSLANDKAGLNPPEMNNGNRWRIAYYEGGEYISYQEVLTETIKSLMQLGWVEPLDIPVQKGEQTKDLWNWLGTNANGGYIEFVKDAHYSASWDEALRPNLAAKLIERLNQQKDIDLIIAMGTWAGQALANNKHKIPMLVLSTSDPIGAGIIKSAEDSGFDHVHARVAPDRFQRQIRLFHEAVNFKKLGIVYTNSETGRSYAALDDVEAVARERRFSITPCFSKTDIPDTKEAEQSVVDCFNTLVNEVDAIYVTAQQGIGPQSLPKLIKIANDNKIPTFSQVGPSGVKLGLLLSTASPFKVNGKNAATNIAKIFHGAKPRDLEQIFEDPPRLAINLKTAEIISYNPPLIVLGAVDEIYREIE